MRLVNVFLIGNQKLIEEKEDSQKISLSLTIMTSLSVYLKTECLMNIITNLVLFHFGGEVMMLLPKANVLCDI